MVLLSSKIFYAMVQEAKLTGEALQKVLAVQFISITGCRPFEAAWVATKGIVTENKVKYEFIDYAYTIDMPLEETKTKTNRPYYWLIEKRFKYFIQALRNAYKPYSVDELYSRTAYAFKCAVSKATGKNIKDV